MKQKDEIRFAKMFFIKNNESKRKEVICYGKEK